MHDLFALESRVRAHQAEVNQYLEHRALLTRLAEPAPEPVRQAAAPAPVCVPCDCAGAA